ncbi:MAG: 4Fe-4S dicluster domain-containing protein [Rhodospirillaceae bacterium]|nr:4Fe-4S dicluster domain-containing protein [Rhodospirillaceae bacterium]
MSEKKLPVLYDDFLEYFPDASGNDVNGLGEAEFRQPSPFFWHPHDKHEFGELQTEVVGIQRRSPAITEHYSGDAPRGPKLIEKAAAAIKKSATDCTAAVKKFALAHEGDDVRITDMDPNYIYEGYELDDPWIIIIGVTMDHEELNKLPASLENPANPVEVAKQYNRAARVCREVTNYILAQGYNAKPWAGPFASALSMMPAAIDSGMGTLGKHGSLIHGEYGSSFRLSAVTTDMPLIADQPRDIGAEDFCANCQICIKACPPGAIFEEKQMVRGVEKWFVDFDKCIPAFGEALGCAACIAKCPWSTPGRAAKLSEKMLNRRALTRD